MGSCCSAPSLDDEHPLRPMGRAKQSGPPTAVANTEEDRAARLAAAERRQQQSDRRGVQKGGGQLAAKLKQQTPQTGNDQPANDNLQWRVD